VLSFFLSGCFVYKTGNLNSGMNTTVLLGDNHYTVVEQGVRAHDSGVHVLGIGSSPEYGVALDGVREKAQLKGASRALANVTTDETSTYYVLGIVVVDKIIVTADVVEFKKQ
jgi:hypothetical protein